jgi:hypothetical protein
VAQVDYEDHTKMELQEELRGRGLPTSGTKDELVTRLQDADEDEREEADKAGPKEPDKEADGDRSGAERRRRAGKRSLRGADVVRLAHDTFADLTGRRPESVTGLSRVDEGWRVLVDVVELKRVPTATDVLATYEVLVDEGGDLLGYERVRRYVRCQANEE